MKVLKRNGEKEIFDEEKFRRSLERSGFGNVEVTAVLDHINKKLYDGISTGEIYKKAYSYLEKTENKLPIVRYSLKRSVQELGPTGFPFEKFVARLFEEKGYQTKTGEMLNGKCIQHETDVLAYKDDPSTSLGAKELILMETKFHNDPSIKTDTKAALYVKARYDDLADMPFIIDGEKREMTKALLITNTHFTNNSIKYVECVGTFGLISWNYPEKGNLLELIEEVKIHPITCISVLSKNEKQRLVDAGYIYCKDLVDKPEVLKQNGVKSSKIDEVMNTLELVCKSHEHKS
jgi:hypothetical protein